MNVGAMAAAAGHRLYPAYHLIAYRGLRRVRRSGCAGRTQTRQAAR
jgi:hypothetical protein